MRLLMMVIAATAALSLTAAGAAELEKWQSLQASPMPSSRESGYAPVNDIEMYYAIYGKGDPILLIPIGMASSEMWAAVIPALSRHHLVIAADTRGTRQIDPHRDSVFLRSTGDRLSGAA